MQFKAITLCIDGGEDIYISSQDIENLILDDIRARYSQGFVACKLILEKTIHKIKIAAQIDNPAVFEELSSFGVSRVEIHLAKKGKEKTKSYYVEWDDFDSNVNGYQRVHYDRQTKMLYLLVDPDAELDIGKAFYIDVPGQEMAV